MKPITKFSNGVRSAMVVIGALAFGYLSLNLGFKPYLEQAAAAQHALQPPTDQPQDSSISTTDS